MRKQTILTPLAEPFAEEVVEPWAEVVEPWAEVVEQVVYLEKKLESVQLKRTTFNGVYW